MHRYPALTEGSSGQSFNLTEREHLAKEQVGSCLSRQLSCVGEKVPHHETGVVVGGRL